jgi:hypothetical protein
MASSTLVSSVTVLLLLAGAATNAADQNVLVDRVRSIRTVQDLRPTSRLIVYVVDDLGRPVSGAIVTVLDGRGQRQLAVRLTMMDGGPVRFELDINADVRVRAERVGFATSEARKVSVRRGRLVALALPLEVGSLVESQF